MERSNLIFKTLLLLSNHWPIPPLPPSHKNTLLLPTETTLSLSPNLIIDSLKRYVFACTLCDHPNFLPNGNSIRWCPDCALCVVRSRPLDVSRAEILPSKFFDNMLKIFYQALISFFFFCNDTNKQHILIRFGENFWANIYVHILCFVTTLNSPVSPHYQFPLFIDAVCWNCRR